MQRFSLSTGGGLVAIVLWSTTFAIARSLSEQVGPLTAASAVYLSGGFFCLLRLAYLTFQGRPVEFRKLSLKYLFGCGSLFALYTALIYLAVGLSKSREQLLEVALINYLWPAATILLSLLLLKTQARWFLWPATALALLGVFLVMTQRAHISWESFREHLKSNPAAYGFAFVAALSWALYSNLARYWSGTGDAGGVELFVPLTGLVLLAMRLVSHEATTWSFHAVLEALLLGGITALGYALWDLAMRKGDLLFVAACSYFTPLLSTVVSCAYLKVAPSTKLWLGCLLIVAGSLASWWSVQHNLDRS